MEDRWCHGIFKAIRSQLMSASGRKLTPHAQDESTVGLTAGILVEWISATSS